MKIHEYQAKAILAQYGIPVPRGRVAFTPEEAEEAARELGTPIVVVKAQIHAGGRGKGGGVKLAHSPVEAKALAEMMLGHTLVTHQTGPEGKEVQKVLIEEGLPIKKELYVGITVDRVSNKPVMIASYEGGMEIEEVARTQPEKILKAPIETSGFSAYQARNLAFGIGLQGKEALACAVVFQKLATMGVAGDTSLVEINPLVITEDGRVIALDGKINFDDNALFRHPDYATLRDLSEEEPLEIEASKYDLNYIKLDGEVGCMVNGAGLAMGTMDMVKLYGSMPANFLDVGGTANVDRVAAAFHILMSDPNVKAVLVNIFGGIVRCDRVAGGIIQALQQVQVDVPIVIRLKGTNADQARQMLKEADFPFIVADTLSDAAEKVVQSLSNAA
ncbi:MAG: ADP-forming succinate--CoA ligase subunit beta [bacterium]|jgi:succinyl-CoA synthetase beta subunit|nr:ADP-forming succinate--CoA ligase subunit beta [bacterium]